MITTAIVQARLNSSRLPNKVLLPLCGLTSLEVQIKRIFQMRNIQHVVIAVPDDLNNDLLETLIINSGATVFRGHPFDVLERTYKAAKSVGSDYVVRIPGDKPLFDPEIGDSVINELLRSGCDYSANNLKFSVPHGFDCEVFTIDALAQAVRHAQLPFDREHVTPFLKRNNQIFNILNVDSGYSEFNKWRFTLDYPEDYQVINMVFRMLEMSFLDVRINDVITLCKNNPEILNLNKLHWFNDRHLAYSP